MIKIIAEVANVHEGEFTYMQQLVKELVKTEIHAIKFQYVIPSEFGDPDSENYIELDRLKFTHEEFEALLHECPPGFRVYYDVFAEGSYNQVKKLKETHTQYHIAGVKLHVTNSMDFELLQRAATDFETVFISISGLTAIEIHQIVKFATERGFFEKIVLVYGVQNYPTQPESIKLNKLSELKRIFGVAVSLSDHLDGDNVIAADMIPFAQLLGYDYIEKHVTLDRARRLDDDHAALNIGELNLAISKSQMLDSTFTDNVLALSADEVDYRNKAKQAIYAKDKILSNEFIVSNAITMKRQEGEDRKLNLLNLNEVRNLPASHDIAAGKRLDFDDIQRSVRGYILVRSGSSRYPNKCYQTAMEGLETLRLLIKRLAMSKHVDEWVLCTTDNSSDDGIQAIGESEGLQVIRGSENVYQRFELAFKTTGKPDVFLRITADNVFIDPTHIDSIMPEFLAGNYDYYRHAAVIDGCDFEIIKSTAYETLNVYFENYDDEAEYMTLFLRNSYFHTMPEKNYAEMEQFEDYRFTLDYQEDLENIRNILKGIGRWNFTYTELCQYLKSSQTYTPFAPPNKAFTIRANKKTVF